MRKGMKDGVLVDLPDFPAPTADLLAARMAMSISPRQMRHALNQLDLRDQVEAAVAASEDQDMIDGWEYADTFDRLHPLVIALGAVLGKTDEELDEIFALGLSDPTFKRPEE